MKIGRCLIDTDWGHSTNVVYQFCRQSPHASIRLPSHGRFVGASSNPFSEYRRRPGDRVGLNWRSPSIHGKRAIRHVIYDTNWWKSFTHARLAVAMGDRGCPSIFGDRAEQHRMFAEQITAEYFIKTECRGRTVDEWKARPEHPDNHWLDCLVGTAVAASMQGALLFGTENGAAGRRDRGSFLGTSATKERIGTRSLRQLSIGERSGIERRVTPYSFRRQGRTDNLAVISIHSPRETVAASRFLHTTCGDVKAASVLYKYNTDAICYLFLLEGRCRWMGRSTKPLASIVPFQQSLRGSD